MSNREAALPLFRLRTALGFLRTLDHTDTFSRFRSLPPSALAVLTATIYYTAAQIGFLMKSASSPISTFWPPNAVLLGILFLTPLRVWWLLLLAVLPVHLLIQLGAGVPLISSLGWYVGNCGEALLGAGFMRIYKKDQPLFETLSGVTVFLALGVLFPVLLTTFIDAGGAVISGLGSDYWTLWTTRLTSNMVADLAIVPLLVIIGTKELAWFPKVKLTKHLELATLFLATIFSAVLAFGRVDITAKIPAVLFLPLFCMVWGTVRLGLTGVCAPLLVISVIAGWNAAHNQHPYTALSTVQAILSIHVLLIAFAVPCMLLAALLAERSRTDQELRSSRLNLIGAREQERSYLAGTLRRDVVESLILAGLDLHKVRAGSPELDVVHDRISKISAATLDLSHSLHPFMLEYLGLSRALNKLCHDIAGRSGITIHFSEITPSYPLSLEASHRLFRITQEVLNEFAERRQATTINTELTVIGHLAALSVSNDAAGTAAIMKRGDGLTYTREQVLALKGTFEITTSSTGTLVQVRLPIETRRDSTLAIV